MNRGSITVTLFALDDAMAVDCRVDRLGCIALLAVTGQPATGARMSLAAIDAR